MFKTLQELAQFAPTPRTAQVETQVDEGLETLLKEGMDYQDSAEFTEEFYSMVSKVNDIKKVVKAPRFMKYCVSTDHNFGTDCASAASNVVAALDALYHSVVALEQEIDSTAHPRQPEPEMPEDGDEVEPKA